jgi:hypothetical protein
MKKILHWGKHKVHSYTFDKTTSFYVLDSLHLLPPAFSKIPSKIKMTVIDDYPIICTQMKKKYRLSKINVSSCKSENMDAQCRCKMSK